VKVAAGTTINTGNFENIRLDVGIEVDGVGDPNPTFDKAWAWVENKLAEKARSIQESL
jgi:hypothetical protein